ncbi:Hypothetical protein, putative [Bodo saltans]|uniref:Uncharacterized protein n=1 Tax=Bodo saltans TaxID=75058 RepID=A0A0S4KMB3_BODSA|nr:Hypothetical protein, putative [Bodo saltans]|eukprot:CUI14741.1 Hypothetical protein, putative [Bodo saltans]
MSSGRICPRCLRDIVIVCQCRVVSVKSNSKPASTSHVIPAPPKPLIATPLPSTTNSQNGSSIIGTSTLLEKSYSRPSAAPTMSLVRPVHVLKEAFGRCIQRPKTDLAYISDQLKSIRQDLTVQASSADSAFKAMVYEYHARVSLLVGNAPEFGQCLNNVHALHAKGYFGTDCHEISPSTSIPAINPPTNQSTHHALTPKHYW